MKALTCQNSITHVSVKQVVKGDQPAITGSFNSLYSDTLRDHIYQ